MPSWITGRRHYRQAATSGHRSLPWVLDFPTAKIFGPKSGIRPLKNPNSSMPPFGKHKLISEKDIDNIVAWLSTL
ncbi:MAG: hypothetical protein ACJ0US_04590 [Arenicellales bacterium]